MAVSDKKLEKRIRLITDLIRKGMSLEEARLKVKKEHPDLFQAAEVLDYQEPGHLVDALAKQFVSEGLVKCYRSGLNLVQTQHPEIWQSYLKGGK